MPVSRRRNPDDSISRSRLVLFLSEVSEPAERPTIPEKLPPITLKHFLLVRPGHDQQISSYRSRENNHGRHDLEGRLNRVDQRRILIDPGLRKHRVISNRPNTTRDMLTGTCIILVRDQILG